MALRDPQGPNYLITEYINFCVDSIIPSRTVKCFPNNKPWFTTDLRELLNRKKRAFRNRDREEQRTVQKELKVKLRESKEAYGRKLESKLDKIM